MSLFNGGVIYHLIRLRRESALGNSQIQHRAMSTTLVITTSLFLMMTVPVNIAYAFPSLKVNTSVIQFLSSITYTYHVTSFPLYMLTFSEFRRECIAMIPTTMNRLGVTPTTGTQMRSVNVV